MTSVCGDLNPIARAQNKLVPGNIEEHFSLEQSSNFAEGMTMFAHRLLRFVDFLEHFKAFAQILAFNLDFCGD